MTQKPSNSLVSKKPKFSVAIQSDMYKNLINNTLGDEKRAARFIAAISSAVATNPALQDCEAGTILSGALLGESLNLSPSPQLGQYYLVPYANKNGKQAVFQIGYKGLVQLALRSGQYKKINVLEIKDGELVSYDPLNEELEINMIEDNEKRENAKTIGYYAMFELNNGFRKSMYWSKEKMTSHAKRYSKAYGTQYSFWTNGFDEMAKKTMLRQLISKWGVMTIDLQNAYESDMAAIDVHGNKSYVDNEDDYDDILGSTGSENVVTDQKSLVD